MTERTLIQTIEANGLPYSEYRYEPEILETTLVTIEFRPESHPLDDYDYSPPRFVFNDTVALQQQWNHCLQADLDPDEELDYYRVCALELVEPKSKSGRLNDAPYWLIGIRCLSGTRELIWFEQDELLSKEDLEFNSNLF